MIVFLDFDGVLNHERWFRRRGPRPREDVWTPAVARWTFDHEAAQRLNRLSDAGARFVVSSTRRGAGLDKVRSILSWLGVRGEVIDITPDLSVKSDSIYVNHARNRGQEIQAWLDANAYAGPFVILDDDDDMGPLLDRLVQTDDRYGLLDEHIDRALVILGRK